MFNFNLSVWYRFQQKNIPSNNYSNWVSHHQFFMQSNHSMVYPATGMGMFQIFAFCFLGTIVEVSVRPMIDWKESLKIYELILSDCVFLTKEYTHHIGCSYVWLDIAGTQRMAQLSDFRAIFAETSRALRCQAATIEYGNVCCSMYLFHLALCVQWCRRNLFIFLGVQGNLFVRNDFVFTSLSSFGRGHMINWFPMKFYCH